MCVSAHSSHPFGSLFISPIHIYPYIRHTARTTVCVCIIRGFHFVCIRSFIYFSITDPFAPNAVAHVVQLRPMDNEPISRNSCVRVQVSLCAFALNLITREARGTPHPMRAHHSNASRAAATHSSRVESVCVWGLGSWVGQSCELLRESECAVCPHPPSHLQNCPPRVRVWCVSVSGACNHTALTARTNRFGQMCARAAHSTNYTHANRLRGAAANASAVRGRVAVGRPHERTSHDAHLCATEYPSYAPSARADILIYKYVISMRARINRARREQTDYFCALACGYYVFTYDDVTYGFSVRSRQCVCVFVRSINCI